MYEIEITHTNGVKQVITEHDKEYEELSVYTLFRMLDKCAIDKFSISLA